MSSSTHFAIPLVLFVLSTIPDISYEQVTAVDFMEMVMEKMDQLQSFHGETTSNTEKLSGTLLSPMAQSGKNSKQAPNNAFRRVVAEIVVKGTRGTDQVADAVASTIARAFNVTKENVTAAFINEI